MHKYLINNFEYFFFNSISLFALFNLTICTLDERTETVDEAENGSDMTLKQGEPEVDQFTIDGLLVNPDDLLPPVVKLEKYVDSDITFNR